MLHMQKQGKKHTKKFRVGEQRDNMLKRQEPNDWNTR
jgi:hypothetical protein